MGDKNPFEYQRPDAAQVEQIEAVRLKCKELHGLLLTLPPCRERSMAVTKIVFSPARSVEP